MKRDKEQISQDEQEQREANAIRRRQDKIRNRFAFLQDVDRRHFQAEYVRAQAKEICKILNELQLTPLNALYSKVYSFATDPEFMYDMYLTMNEFDVLEPDEERIKKLIIPEKTKED